MTIENWQAAPFRIAQLLYLFLPVYLANMAPPFTRFWRGWNPPISARWFGSHKTVLGFVVGVITAILVTCAQSKMQWRGQLLDYSDWLAFGFACGMGALGGDCIKSFFKRRLGIAPGRAWIPADQLDFVIGGLIAICAWRIDISLLDALTVIALSFIGDIAVNHASFYLGIRTTKW